MDNHHQERATSRPTFLSRRELMRLTGLGTAGLALSALSTGRL